MRGISAQGHGHKKLHIWRGVFAHPTVRFVVICLLNSFFACVYSQDLCLQGASMEKCFGSRLLQDPVAWAETATGYILRNAQAETMKTLLGGTSVALVQPTGTGKSLAYMLMALGALKGTLTIVVRGARLAVIVCCFWERAALLLGSSRFRVVRVVGSCMGVDSPIVWSSAAVTHVGMFLFTGIPAAGAYGRSSDRI